MPLARRADSFRPRKQAVQARSQRTVEAILKASAQVFAQRGYAAGTTNHIAERAGVSIGTLYEYFPNKDAILVALMEAHLHEGEAILEQTAVGIAAAPGTLRDSLRQFVRAMVEFHARDRGLHRVLFEEAPLPRRIRRQLGDMEQRVTDRVEILLREHPDASVANPKLAAAIAVQAVEGLTHKLVVHGDARADEEYIEEIVRLLGNYLTVD